MLRCGMVVLVEADSLPRRARNKILAGGLFCVGHKRHADRLIFDRRRQNHCETRLGWAELPMGAQLARSVLKRGQAIRGSGFLSWRPGVMFYSIALL